MTVIIAFILSLSITISIIWHLETINYISKLYKKITKQFIYFKDKHDLLKQFYVYDHRYGIKNLNELLEINKRVEENNIYNNQVLELTKFLNELHNDLYKLFKDNIEIYKYTNSCHIEINTYSEKFKIFEQEVLPNLNKYIEYFINLDYQIQINSPTLKNMINKYQNKEYPINTISPYFDNLKKELLEKNPENSFLNHLIKIYEESYIFPYSKIYDKSSKEEKEKMDNQLKIICNHLKDVLNNSNHYKITYESNNDLIDYNNFFLKEINTHYR